MKRSLTCLKMIALAAAIALGLGAESMRAHAAQTEVLTVAGGCFWCVEADFEKVKGVQEVVSGYTGGTLENPTYDDVTGGNTGHYEAVQIRYDPAQVTRPQLLSMFFRSVDPTDAGGQFCDRGDSYRTAIFVSDPAEKADAERAKADAAATFYEAEAYHQDYYKGDKLILTRFGPKRQAEAYNRYRDACGRDQRVRQLWGDAAPFAGK